MERVKQFLQASGETKPKFTKDHEYPRKVSGMELLKRNWNDDVDIIWGDNYLWIK